ncbi:MAG: hypothetical protein Fur0032_05980 [Terrimicrobiaceae bacterium]
METEFQRLQGRGVVLMIGIDDKSHICRRMSGDKVREGSESRQARFHRKFRRPPGAASHESAHGDPEGAQVTEESPCDPPGAHNCDV